MQYLKKDPKFDLVHYTKTQSQVPTLHDKCPNRLDFSFLSMHACRWGEENISCLFFIFFILQSLYFRTFLYLEALQVNLSPCVGYSTSAKVGLLKDSHIESKSQKKFNFSSIFGNIFDIQVLFRLRIIITKMLNQAFSGKIVLKHNYYYLHTISLHYFSTFQRTIKDFLLEILVVTHITKWKIEKSALNDFSNFCKK